VLPCPEDDWQAAGADNISATKSLTLFKAAVVEGDDTLKQVFNLSETGLFWKHMSIHIFINI
jgi:hypothetical protein